MKRMHSHRDNQSEPVVAVYDYKVPFFHRYIVPTLAITAILLSYALLWRHGGMQFIVTDTNHDEMVTVEKDKSVLTNKTSAPDSGDVSSQTGPRVVQATPQEYVVIEDTEPKPESRSNTQVKPTANAKKAPAKKDNTTKQSPAQVSGSEFTDSSSEPEPVQSTDQETKDKKRVVAAFVEAVQNGDRESLSLTIQEAHRVLGL